MKIVALNKTRKSSDCRISSLLAILTIGVSSNAYFLPPLFAEKQDSEKFCSIASGGVHTVSLRGPSLGGPVEVAELREDAIITLGLAPILCRGLSPVSPRPKVIDSQLLGVASMHARTDGHQILRCSALHSARR